MNGINYTQHGNFLQVKMPECYPKESHDFIVEQLSKLPFSKRDRVCKLYSEAYQEAHDLEPISYRKDNAARRSANNRLRVYVRNYRAVTQGLVSKPPKCLSQGEGAKGSAVVKGADRGI